MKVGSLRFQNYGVLTGLKTPKSTLPGGTDTISLSKFSFAALMSGKGGRNVSLPITARSHYQTLLVIVEDDLKPIIEVRNKLAHGQWSRTLKTANDDFFLKMLACISGENALTVKFEKRLLNYLAELIHDLVAGNNAVEHSFDLYSKNLEQAKRDTTDIQFSSWLTSMRNKITSAGEQRGQGELGSLSRLIKTVY